MANISPEYRAEQITMGNLENVHGYYIGLLEQDFARIPGVSLEQAAAMANCKGNSLEGIASSIGDPNGAGFWLTYDVTGEPIVAAKAGPEYYGDRYDLSAAGGLMAGLLHKSGFFRPTTAQIFSFGMDYARLPEEEQQQMAFRATMTSIIKGLGDEIDGISAFVDTRDSGLLGLMNGFEANRTGRDARIGRKTVEITQGGVSRGYRRVMVGV